MKNKFEALKAFQSWPREWQELCAEYWAEGDASVPVALQEGGVRFTGQMLPSQSHECQIKPHKCDASVPVALQEPSKPALPAIGDPFPHDGPKIGFGCIDQGEMKLEPMPVRRAAKVQPMKPWSMADDEALVKLHDTGIRRSQIIMRFMANHPYRTFNAVASRHDHLRRLDWKVQ